MASARSSIHHIGAGGSLKSAVTGIRITDNGALPTCAARKVHDALLKKPDYFCYTPNKLDACTDDPDICIQIEPP